jgi:hypothetical protein
MRRSVGLFRKRLKAVVSVPPVCDDGTFDDRDLEDKKVIAGKIVG